MLGQSDNAADKEQEARSQEILEHLRLLDTSLQTPLQKYDESLHEIDCLRTIVPQYTRIE